MTQQITPVQPDNQTEEIIKTEFPAYPFERFFFVAYTQAKASNTKPLMRKLLGDEYVEKWVDCREVKGIAEWGLGLWSDKFVFDHTVWDSFSDLAPADQQFMIMLTQDQKIGSFFGVRPNIKFGNEKKKFFGRFRAWLKSKL